MKFSELWLREWVNVAIDSKALSKQITMAGLTVESVDPVSGIFFGVVIGEIVECDQHPNADRLKVIKVNIGCKHLLDIVCGAPNCREGLKVAVATVGAVLPDDFKIKRMKICGKVSEGILCSYSELGIPNDYIGIIEFPMDAPIGTDIRDYLKLDDNIIEISITPNRADCLSIIGVARDVAVLNRIGLNMPNTSPVEVTSGDMLPIQVEASNACPRYLGRVVEGINVKAMTPIWMKEKLRRCGIRSINAVVDVSNYILLELGQPMRIFDKDQINGGIIVRIAKKGETLFSIDGRKITLNVDSLVITDHEKTLSIGSIVENEHSNVNNETKNIFLECIFFNPYCMTALTYYHALPIDIPHQYKFSIDPALQHNAMERATHLLIEICGGKPGIIIDVTNEAMLPKRSLITLRRSKLDRLIGCHIEGKQVSDILRRLGYEVIEDNDQWKTVSPSWRFDMKIEEDLVEEIARVYGYNNIPNKPVRASLIMGQHRETNLSLKRVKMLLNDKGYQEVITYSFVDPKVQQLIHPGKKMLILPNPISNEMSAMRVSLWSGLLKTIIYNQNRQQSRVRIYEAGLCFVPDIQVNLGVHQNMMLAGAICGNRYEDHWDLTKDSVDFYDMKGDLESILDLTGKLSEIKFHRKFIPALHPGQSAEIYLQGEHIGFIGVVHPKLERKLKLNGRTIIFELEWNKIADRIVPKVQDISRFPTNRRDIAVVVPENVPAADILAECKKVVVNYVVSINLFDVYRGHGVAQGCKSLAISLILQDIERTLKEEEITTIVTKCVAALKERFQASLRD